MTTCVARMLTEWCSRPAQRGDYCARHIQEDRCARAVRTPYTFADHHQCRKRPTKGFDYCRVHRDRAA